MHHFVALQYQVVATNTDGVGEERSDVYMKEHRVIDRAQSWLDNLRIGRRGIQPDSLKIVARSIGWDEHKGEFTYGSWVTHSVSHSLWPAFPGYELQEV
jgi:hypothetical protein